ncbi:MAG: hypothetical protein WB696_10295 [Chthoniobacterales bacterium]
MRGPVDGHEVRHLFATKIKQVVVIGGLTEVADRRAHAQRLVSPKLTVEILR